MQQLKNYIGGHLQEPISKQWIQNYNPATGEVYSQLPDSDERDIQRAVEVAQTAFLEWSTTSAEERSRVLLRVADLIERDLAMARSFKVPE